MTDPLAKFFAETHLAALRRMRALPASTPDTAFDALHDVREHLKAALTALEAAQKKHAWSEKNGDLLKDTEATIDDCRSNVIGIMRDIELYGEF